jgi:hypothetical protein
MKTGRTVLLAALAACASMPVRAVAQATTRAPRPHAPYVTAACPFECCTYGRWRFVTPAPVRAAARRSAAVVARIGAGERVRADSGHVRLDTLGLVLVRRDFRDADAGAEYRAGDTLLVLDYLGEGFSHVWVRGERRQLSLVDVLASHGPISGADTATLVELRPPAAAWWVHVTLSARAPKATRGWVLMTPELDVRGADACGGPDEGP